MLKQIAQALGFSSILLLLNYVDLTSSADHVRFHWPKSMRSIAIANLLDIVIVTVFFGLVIWLLRKSSWWPHIRFVLAAALPAVLLIRNLPLFPIPVPLVYAISVIVIWVVVLMWLRVKTEPIYGKLTGFCGIVLAGFAVFAGIMSLQLVRSMVWRPGPQQITSSVGPEHRDKPLLVWIIFDELSYDQAFEHRDPSLALPNFDRLRTVSATFTNVAPIADKTQQVVPSLLLGKRMTDLDYSWSNQLSYQADNGPWQMFDQRQTLFGAARNGNLRTAIVGWYLPYCSLLPDVVDECYWTNSDALESEMAPDASLARNTVAPLLLLAKQVVTPRRAETDAVAIEARAHWETFNELRRKALAALDRRDNDFVLLHLPVPHPPGMYSRRRQQFSPTGSYLGSLVLADQSLGAILASLQSSPRWASTTLIVMGDHSWRVGMWSSRPGWSARNQTISHGQFDPRPVLMIHKPGQTSGSEIAATYPQLQLHDSIECALLKQRQECF